MGIHSQVVSHEVSSSLSHIRPINGVSGHHSPRFLATSGHQRTRGSVVNDQARELHASRLPHSCFLGSRVRFFSRINVSASVNRISAAVSELDDNQAAYVGRNQLPDATVESLGPNTRRVSASIQVDASLDTLWGVLTDYESLADFIPSLAINELLEKRENGAKLLQVGEQPLALGVKFKAKAIVDVEEGSMEFLDDGTSDGKRQGKGSDDEQNPISSTLSEVSRRRRRRRRGIGFRMLEGDFKQFEGAWNMTEKESPCSSTLSYSVVVTPHLWLPVAVIEGRISKEICSNLESVGKEAEEREQEQLGRQSLRGTAIVSGGYVSDA